MSTVGIMMLGLAFAAILFSIGLSFVGNTLSNAIQGTNEKGLEKLRGSIDKLGKAAYISALITALVLTIGCGILVYGFITGNPSLEYVVRYHSNSKSSLRLLYEIAGLWAGREGSLLFWAWLIGLFGAAVALKGYRHRERLDSMALAVIQIVLLAFVAVLLFSDSNMPFKPLSPGYLNLDGTLMTYDEVLISMMTTGNTALNPGLVIGMNVFLEHWAMAIHPPTLFVGYAGLTVPFAYAIAALIVNDPSKKWVESSQRYALFSWVFLGIGIGLGAVWAYVVLGWGGYWGWDPVENASLLPWVLAIALVHSFTLYRQRGIFKGWSVICACLTFSFVIISTYITRSGVIQDSVHVFDGDLVSKYLFLSLIILSMLAGFVGLFLRRKKFSAKASEEDLGDSFFTRDVAYYFTNVIVIIGTIALLYLTVTSALPLWMPFGGQSLPTSTFDLVARPVTIIFCLVMAVCPMLSWIKTDGKKFLKKSMLPGIGALLLFVVLCVYFVVYLKPAYDGVIAAGDEFARTRLEAGPPIYYFTLTLLGFFVASLLFFNSLFMLGRLVREQAKVTKSSPFAAFFPAIWNKASRFGGFLSHLSLSIILIGLIGSSMYVTEVTDYIPYDSEKDEAGGVFVIKDYHLIFSDTSWDAYDDGNHVFIYRNFDVYKNDVYLGKISPGVQNVYHSEYIAQQERKALAAVISTPASDLFVVYNGISMFGEMSITVKINPLISLVWAGFGLLMVGTIIATVGKRNAGVVVAAGKGGKGGKGKPAQTASTDATDDSTDDSTDATDANDANDNQTSEPEED